MQEKITIHAMTTSTDEVVKFARIIQVQGLSALGKTLLPHRLSRKQLKRAIDLSVLAVDV